MGCDIHGHIEVRYHTDTNWYHSVPIEGKRCYNIFARLAKHTEIMYLLKQSGCDMYTHKF